MSNITPEESFLIQSLALFECFIKIGELEIREDPLIINNIDRIFHNAGKMMKEKGLHVFKGQGVLVSVFYMFLVLPHEWRNKKIGDFERLDLSGPEHVAEANAEVTIDYENKEYGALRHFRNALAHGRINWSADGKLIIEDQNRAGEIYRAEYSIDSLGELAESLNSAIFQYIQSVIGQRRLQA